MMSWMYVDADRVYCGASMRMPPSNTMPWPLLISETNKWKQKLALDGGMSISSHGTSNNIYGNGSMLYNCGAVYAVCVNFSFQKFMCFGLKQYEPLDEKLTM